jgi:hypothetical protein
MGKPDDLADYVTVVVGEWGRRYGTLYIARDIWASLKPQARDFVFYVAGGKRCRVCFDLPVSKFQP